MFRKLSKILQFQSRYSHLYVFKMDKAYLRHIEDYTKFEISFKYQNADPKVDRQFNLTRQMQEPVKAFLDRVATNVDKVLNKKAKKKKGNNGEEKMECAVKTSLMEKGTEVNYETKCEDVFKEGTDLVLNINNSTYNVIVNAPWVSNVALPKSILAGFPVYPIKFDHSYTNLAESTLTWYVSSDKVNWSKVGEGYLYEPKNSEINSHIKLSVLPKNSEREGPIVEVTSDNKIEAGPGHCPFEIRHAFTSNKCTENIFRAISYNLLADLYADRDHSRAVLFPYCPPYALAIDYRKQLFLKEIMGYNADIICLQEVDTRIYHHDLVPILSNLGFDSMFAAKGGTVAEGVACFVDKKRFRILEKKSMELSKELDKEEILKEIYEAICRNEKLKERVLERTTVMQLLLMQSVDNENNLVLVGNTHLYFQPDADHIRLLQGSICIKLLEKYQKEYSSSLNKNVGLMFCGDLNSSPDCGIYTFMTEGEIHENLKDWSSNPEETVKGLNLSQPFQMQSACGVPKYTNFTDGFKDCLDWIYYDTNKFSVEQMIPLPSDEELQEHIAIPSVVFPSDHVALVVDLKIK